MCLSQDTSLYSAAAWGDAKVVFLSFALGKGTSLGEDRDVPLRLRSMQGYAFLEAREPVLS